MALTSMGVYGVIIAGWASNSKYAFLGAMRSAAQMVSYELAMGFALVVVLMVSGQPEPVGDRRGAGQGLVRRARAHVPVVELAAAPSDAGGVLRRRRGRDQPRALRRRRGRVRDRRRPHGRVLGDDLRPVLPRRVREHDPDHARCARSCSSAAGWRRSTRRCSAAVPPFLWLLRQGVRDRLVLPLVPRHLPALPLRPDHAPGLEGVHPAHHRVDRGDRRVDADAAGVCWK